MKSLQESLFDSDLVSKDISVLSIITNYLSDYLNGNTGSHQWVSTILKIIDGISYKRPAMHKISPNKIEISDDELYISIDPHIYKQIVLIGWGLTGKKSSVPDIVILSYSKNLGDICADLYRTKNVDYKNILNTFYFNQYRVNKEDINTFKKEILDNIENAFNPLFWIK